MRSDIYLDNPLAIEKEIEELTDKERELFNKGYITALYGIIEQLVASKTTLLEATLGVKDNPHHYNQLVSKVELLDKFEEHYSKRVKMICASMSA